MNGRDWCSALLEKLTSLLSDFTDSKIQLSGFLPDSGFQSLNPYKASQEFDQPQWKQLYNLLLQISVYSSSFDDLKQFAVDELKLRGIATLSDHLFEEVDGQFEFISSDLVSTQNQSDILSPLDGHLSLLRCCLLILPLLEFDPCIIAKKRKTLVGILGRTCHLSSVLCDSSIFNVYSADQVANYLLVLNSVLEVFMDELQKDKRLSKHFTRPEYVTLTKNKAFPSVHDFIILEVVCCHFLLSVSNKCSLDKYLDSLFWSYLNFRTPKLTLTAGLTLLRSSIICSAPQMILAHLVSLVSSCVAINLIPFESKASLILLSQYVSAFELSINIYNRERLKLEQVYSHNEEVHDLSFPDIFVATIYQASFQCCVLPVTFEKISFQLHELIKANQPCSGSVNSQGLGPDLLCTSAAFIQENQHILDEFHQHEICSILKSIIKIILSRENLVNAASVNSEVSQQEVYVLAAALKLMGCTLLHIVGYMKESRGTVLFRSPGDHSSCKEYDVIIKTIACFGQSSYPMPCQKVLMDGLGMDAVMQTETMLMLIHLAGWLVFAFQSGHDFLWKSYIFMMMALMNLVILEEGHIDLLRKMLVSAKESSCCHSSLAKFPQDGKPFNIALNFHKIQKTLKARFKHLDDEIQGAQNVEKAKVVDLESKDDGTCNGENYIKCIGNLSDFDDLVDFIACTPGKDYSAWLKKKERFKQWKESKRQDHLLATKKKCWNSRKSCRSQRSFPYLYKHRRT
ncbi:hypothetical protein H6P81_020301 [Aristolochia fimbriata]|uniref:DUF7812 domain-containing protein n=1 Tax=Aristolochia fimbriata TaxID=158543 RepID=A0AAV7DV74_ARIFI|nr:hypothetical protein H6P81_020301 [Aristolochia fimbriata]